ncbi:hypothetical protein HZS_2115 [Henneguya salminicola]|nr:hypothetical protein HZS_2115 [Henneguya salminicola]
MRRKLADENLLQRYNTDPDFALAARRIVPLSFVLIEDIDVAFKARENEIAEDLTPILNLFEDVYIGLQNRNRTRRSAFFPPKMGSVYERTVNGEDRANNNVKAALWRLQAEFRMDHPNILKFIDGIRSVKKGRDLVYEQFVRGDPPPVKRRKYIATDIRILKIVESYRDRNIIEYLGELLIIF